MLITDQVATAPCTDCIQARCLTFEASTAKRTNSAFVQSLCPAKDIGILIF